MSQSKKSEKMSKVETTLAEIKSETKRLQIMMKEIVDVLDFWEGLLIMDTMKGLRFQIQIRDANLQRGGGGKRTKYKYEGVLFESGQALCDELNIPVSGDSAVRKLERYAKDNPDVKFEVL